MGETREDSNLSQTGPKILCGQDREIRFPYNTHKYPNRAYLAETQTQSATNFHSLTTCSDMSQTPAADLSHASVSHCEPICSKETVPVSPSAITASAAAQVLSSSSCLLSSRRRLRRCRRNQVY
jgi:hypothetical protein